MIARHLAGLIERSLRLARTPEARIAIVRDVLSVLPDPDALRQAIYEETPYRIKRMDAVMPAGVVDSARYLRPATPRR